MSSKEINTVLEYFKQHVLTCNPEQLHEKYRSFIEHIQLMCDEQLQILRDLLDNGDIFLPRFVEICIEMYMTQTAYLHNDSVSSPWSVGKTYDGKINLMYNCFKNDLKELADSFETDSYQYKCVHCALFFVFGIFTNLNNTKIGKIHDERILQDIEYILSCECSSFMLDRILTTIESSRRSYNTELHRNPASYKISSRIAELILERIDHNSINQMIAIHSVNIKHTHHLTHSDIIKYIFDDHSEILRNDILLKCCQIFDKPLSSKCLAVIQDRLLSDDICIDVVRLSNMKDIIIENVPVSHVVDLFKRLNSHDEQMEVMSLLIRSRKYITAKNLIDYLY